MIRIANESDMRDFGARLGAAATGGLVIELIGDVGAGKTTLTKGIGFGLAVDEEIQSPSFTISRTYAARDELCVAHYDFYRLTDAGIMADELIETVSDRAIVTIIEWATIVEGVLPKDRLRITFSSPTEHSRQLVITSGGPKSNELMKALL